LSDKKMNFVFFFADEMRAESLACYGHPVVQTPNIDRLAGQGVRFEQCHVQHTVCTPSRASLMTGWYPHVSGHRTLWHLLRPHEPSMFRYLKEAGYHIEWHGKNDLYSPEYFPIAVDQYNVSAKTGTQAGGPTRAGRGDGHGRGERNAEDKPEPPLYSFLRNSTGNDLHRTGDMPKVQRGIDFLQSRRADDPPFMLYLPLSVPHPPYHAPEPFHSMYDPDKLPPLRPHGLNNKPDFYRLIREYRHLDEEPERLMRQIQAVYLGAISYSDWMLGQLLETLEQTGLADNTTVIFAADHGDWAGDYGLVEKWPSGLDDTLTHVPLIIRTPGNSAGHVVPEQVELFDIMATVLDLAGLKAEHSHFARSLTQQLHGAPGDAERAVFAEGGYDVREPHCFEGSSLRESTNTRNTNHVYWPKGLQQQEQPLSVCRATMIRTLTHKLVRRVDGVSELYDLQADPQELNNVYGDSRYAEVRSNLESRMLDWYIRTSDVTPFQEDPRGFPGDAG
jgi:choline-sulfatase